MKKQIVSIGHPALSRINEIISDFGSEKLQMIIEQLKEVMRDNELIGIAAPQISENYKVFVTELRDTNFRESDQQDELRVFINPQITWHSEEKNIIFEGCGSLFANIFGPVERSKTIKVEAFDENGRKFELECDGILARVIQHEIDHLKGTLFIEKVEDYKKLMDAEFYKQNIKNSKIHIENSMITIKNFKYL